MQELSELKEDVVRVKDLHGRQFQALTRNFYVIRAAVRYFAVKQGLSFTSSKVAENFPLTVSSAGSSLNALEHLGVIESRTSSRKRFLPKDTDMERLSRVEDVLRDNFEISEFRPG
ncbi:MAG: hypothetical protein ABEJ87_02965 [Candidatus Nanohalobium sp.]